MCLWLAPLESWRAATLICRFKFDEVATLKDSGAWGFSPHNNQGCFRVPIADRGLPRLIRSSSARRGTVRSLVWLDEDEAHLLGPAETALTYMQNMQPSTKADQAGVEVLLRDDRRRQRQRFDMPRSDEPNGAMIATGIAVEADRELTAGGIPCDPGDLSSAAADMQVGADDHRAVVRDRCQAQDRGATGWQIAEGISAISDAVVAGVPERPDMYRTSEISISGRESEIVGGGIRVVKLDHGKVPVRPTGGEAEKPPARIRGAVQCVSSLGNRRDQHLQHGGGVGEVGAAHRFAHCHQATEQADEAMP